MDTKIAARMIAVFAIGAGLTAAITALHDDEDRPDAAAPRIERPGGDLARKQEFARCRDLGTAALEDAACRKAWAENRRRFFQINRPNQPTPPKLQSGSGGTGIDKETGRE
ncbi:putative entry exclusion protein TrbK-alt [Agrobacterium vitis]|uniref:putative entry exclusion protein TrbK-alt n=1 Tax=Agrobacterium vitis TaxID=373 RepID=UPI001F3F15C0|nr:putative entry exclusion protein TrbK-alt [Agrobacterium vitis]MCE6076381.1 putative entry exclusion protein TrbK-alt [Agrobacterium vitis]